MNAFKHFTLASLASLSLFTLNACTVSSDGGIEGPFNDANFENVTFQVTDGELKIKKATLTITITGDKKEYTYDGTAKTAEGYEAASESSLFDEAKVVFDGTAKVTETAAGTYPMGLTAAQFSYNDANFENVTFNVTEIGRAHV